MDIIVEQLNIFDGNYQILKNLTLDLSQRRFIGIVGPNGSGKSTFLKAISRSLQPQIGQIMFDGKDLNKMSYKESSQLLASLSQEHEMPFDFQARELIMMGRYPYKKIFESENEEDEVIVNQAIEQVGISNIQYKNYQHLSGGEKQRVLIARMIAQKSEVLILDEPTNHLDISYQLELFKFLKSLDLTVISAIHDLNIAATYCDYLIILKDGEVYTQGEPSDILTKTLIANVFNVEVDIMTHPQKSRPVIVY